MICGLHIENIAVVKSLDIEFGSGFNVLTGETGAGKSIIIDSLNLLSGGRADRELIRRGEATALVSAVFTDIDENTRELIGEMGFDCEDGELMLSRSVTSDGRSSAKLDGRNVTLSVLKEISSVLFNIHGQNDNQSLLHQANHIRILDRFALDGDEICEYSKLYREILHLRTEIDSLSKDTMEKNRLSEMLAFQVSDIDSAKLKPGEEEALEDEQKKLENLERVNKSIALVRRAVSGSEKGAGAIYLCERASSALSQIGDCFPEAIELSERLSTIRYELEDIAESAEAINDIDEADPTARLDAIGARLDLILRFKRKYGPTVSDILAFRENAQKKLGELENSEFISKELEQKLASLEEKARNMAELLHQKRISAGAVLRDRVSQSLEFLDMPKVRFDVSVVQERELNAFGFDRVEFLISTNVGEPLMPMAKIASGGELARIMLSLRSVINDCDGTSTMIFDEIDTGISGKTSRKVGIKLCQIAKSAQVICVTHSAQIASLGDSHFLISKSENEGRMQTSVSLLEDDDRVSEIARILGGIDITDIQRKAAREMIDERINLI